MERVNNNIKSRKNKHINYEERIKIEALYKLGLTPTCIGEQVSKQSRIKVKI